MLNPPCKDCIDRHDLCHSHCKRYLAFHEERQKILEERYKKNQTIGDLNCLAMERSTAWKRAYKDRQLRKDRGEHK